MRSQRAQSAQAAAAACRLQAEMGRFLACLTGDTTDLNASLYEQMGRSNATAGRLKTCYSRFGRYPDWDELTLKELQDWLAATPDSRRQIMVTGTELDAALGDPRWAAVTPTAGHAGRDG